MSTAKEALKAAAHRAARWVPRKPRPAILMYHRIGYESFDPWGLAVEEHRFAEQLDWLARNRTVLPLGEFARLHQERRLPADAIALTFDDGYASVLHAVPLLSERGMHATVFLPVQLIERESPFWWDELAALVLGWKSDMLSLGNACLPVGPPHERDGFWPPGMARRTPRQKLYYSLWSMLRRMTPAQVDVAIDQLRGQASFEPAVTEGPMSPGQVRSVSASVISFGSHGLNHPSLPLLNDEEKAREIGLSRARCRALTGTEPDFFAYPFGDVDKTLVRLAEEAGYACACATAGRFVTARNNCFALPRLHVGNWEPYRLRDMLGG